MITKGRAIAEMLRWLDEATVNGQPATAEQIADYKDRANYMLDGAVKFLSGHFKIPAVHSVVRRPIVNLAGTGFGAEAVYPDKPFSISAEGAKSFYLEYEGSITLDVNGTATQLKSAEYAAVKGNIPNAGGIVTITVTSAYPAMIRYAALYGYEYETDEAVPAFTPYVAYEMPADFREFDKCLQTSDGHQYREYPDIKREGHRTYLLPYDAQGQFEFHYWRNPAEIPVDAPDETVLEVEDKAAQLVGLKLAVDLTVGVDDTMTVSYYLDNKFNYLINNILTEDKGGRVSIETIYSMD